MNSAQQDIFIGDYHAPSFNHAYFVCFCSVLSLITLPTRYQASRYRRKVSNPFLLFLLNSLHIAVSTDGIEEFNKPQSSLELQGHALQLNRSKRVKHGSDIADGYTDDPRDSDRVCVRRS